MSHHLTTTAARLQQAVPAAEAQVDGALIALSSLMAEVVTARRDTDGVPAAKGHATIHRLAQAQLALVGVSGEILRVHGDLTEIGRETSGLDLHECPAVATAGPTKLAVVR
ncbi:MAG: hypothetical protein U0S50_08820 [Sphingopyxis sp.]|uniref:hypothetical protein n=1 Tax=Sphingopyxis sp. TaxID=1908224 RepID=UPI002ABAC833|nr:hypothetical protein [Sphingopyxis sp.]MDZ3831902.1 hypothetical protein [Sphingopyxis sp.]